MAKQNTNREQELREQRDQAERDGDTARVAEIDRQLNDLNPSNPQR